MKTICLVFAFAFQVTLIAAAKVPLVNPTTGKLVDLPDAQPMCYRQIEQHIRIETCKTTAFAKWPGALTHQSISWELCCAFFDELDCIKHKAVQYCNITSTMQPEPMVSYLEVVADYFNDAICPSLTNVFWQSECTKPAHADRVAKFQANPPSKQLRFFNLPEDNHADLDSTINWLRNHDDTIVERCYKAALDKYDPHNEKYLSSTLLEGCCANYETLDCVQDAVEKAAALNVFNHTELLRVQKYHKDAVLVLGETICYMNPYVNRNQICQLKSTVPTTHATTHAPITTPTHVTIPVTTPATTRAPNPDSDLAKSCLAKLDSRSHLAATCRSQTLTTFLEQELEGKERQACCEIYTTLDCIDREGKKMCTDEELIDFLGHQLKTKAQFAQGLCKAVPSNTC